MKNIISQSLGLDLVNINVYAKVYQTIPLSLRDRAFFHFFRIWTSAAPRSIPNDIWQSLGLHLININAYAKFDQNIPNGLRVIDNFQHFLRTGQRKNHFFRIWTSATLRPIPNGIWQSFMLHLVNINAYEKFYQNIPNGLRVIDIFHEQAGVKIFTNCRWQNQMFDYRAQLSVDVFRAV